MARLRMRAVPMAALAFAVVGAVASVPISLGREPVYDTILYPLNGISLAVAGALIASYHRTNPLGWLLAALGVESAWVEFAEGYGYHPSFPASSTVEWLGNWTNMLGIGATAIVLTLFPTGRGLSRGRQALVWAGAVSTGLMAVGTAFGHPSDTTFRSGHNPYAIGGLEPVYLAGQMVFTFSLVLAIVVLVVRFFRARGIERQQLKWVTYVVGLLAIAGPMAIFFYYDSVLVQIVIAVVVTCLPAAICVAILRYRLYDIDIIVNRTVAYGLLTIMLAGAYLGSAFVLGALVGQRRSAWVTAGATLTVAAAFRPLRVRVQRSVDRRFQPVQYAAFAQVDTFLADVRIGRAAPESLPRLLQSVTGRPEVRLQHILPDEPVPDQPASGVVQRVVSRADTPLAVLTYAEDAPPEMVHLLVQLVERAGLAVEIGRLRAVVQRQLAEVEASRARIVAAGYEERRRLERDLHDGAQQRLVGVGLALRHIQFQLGETNVARDVDATVAELTSAIAELRQLAHGVRPAYLNDGLEVALPELTTRTPLPATVDVQPGRYPADIEATAYFVASEALANTVKHANATVVEIRTSVVGDKLKVTIHDDGVGGADPARGSGLSGLSDRVDAQGGRLHIDSRPSAGTTITAELPCGS